MSKLDAKLGHDSCRCVRLHWPVSRKNELTYLGMVNSVCIRPMEVPRYAIAVRDRVEALQPFCKTTKPAFLILDGLVEVTFIVD